MKLWIFLCVSLAVANIISAKRVKKKGKKEDNVDLMANLTALWEKVNRMTSGVQIHVHGMNDAEPHMEDGADGTHVHLHMHMEDHENHHRKRPAEYRYGVCRVVPNSELSSDEEKHISGNIYFRQRTGEHLEIKVHLEGFDVSEGHSHTHGLHVHQYGDMSERCQSMGSHFNPDNSEHGGPNGDDRHSGDYGNIVCDDEGVVHKTFYDDHTDLAGPKSILGRGIVIHASADDLGKSEDASGGAGDRLACCVVVETADLNWDTIHGEHEATLDVADHEHHDHYKHHEHDHHRHHPRFGMKHDPNHKGHDNHEGHAHENHPYHPGHERHEGHVHPEDHDVNHPGHENHEGHAHENHPDHPGHSSHEGHIHPDEMEEEPKPRKKGGKGKNRKKKS